MMSHPENEKYLEEAHVAFGAAMQGEKYFEALSIVRELRQDGFLAEAMTLWEELYSTLGEDYEKLLQ